MIAVLEWCLGLHIVPLMMTRSISIRKGQRTLGNLVAGHLHLISIGQPSFTQFDVVELERDYSGWFVKYKVDLENSAYCGFAILFLAREENEAAEDDSCMFLPISGKLISYNIRDGTFKTVMDDMATYSKDAYYYTKT